MQRLFNFAFLGIIGLSLLAQTIRFGLAMSGNDSAMLSGLLDILGAAIVPGTALAVLKFMLYGIRSFRDPSARLLAGGYALIMAWPLVLGGVVAASAIGGMTQSNATGTYRELRVPDPDATVSYLEGQAWAQAHRPTRRPDCAGNGEFVRGCAAWIHAQRQEQARAGSEWAQANRPQRGSQCRGTPDFILGCRTWYHQQPAPAAVAALGPFGTRTTAECVQEVNANYEVMRDLDLLDGNDRAPEETRRRHWDPDLKACEQLDRAR